MVSTFKEYLIKSFLVGVLFTCVLIGLSSAPIFAASEESPSSEVSSWLAPDLDSVHAKALAEQLSDRSVQVDYTTTDIYNLLYNAMRGEVYNSSYSLPRIASYTNRIAQILYGSGQSVPSTSLYSRVNTINSIISDLFHAVVDGSSSNIPVGPGIRQMLYGIDSGGDWETLFDTSQDSRDLLQLIYASSQQIHGDGQNNSYYLSQIYNKLNPYNWLSTTSSYIGTSTGWNTTFISSTTSSSSLKVGLSLTGISINTPCVLRIYLPIYPQSSYVNSSGLTINAVKRYYNNSFADLPIDWDYYIEPTNNGSYIYIFGYRYTWQNVFFEFVPTGSGNVTYNPSVTPSVSYIPFNTDEYQQLKIAFSMDQFSDSVSALSNYLVSPQKQAAEDASQAVIDDTLDGFTGNGSAAAKTSDTGSMKNMSGSIQSGLNSGASASNAASVFSNQTFWSWFTQATSDGINNPYPAPSVQATRASGDYVPDFLSGNESELQDLLNQRNSW